MRAVVAVVAVVVAIVAAGSIMSAKLSSLLNGGPYASWLVRLGLPCMIVAALWFAAHVATREGVYIRTVQDFAARGDTAGVERELGRPGANVDAGEPGSGRTALMSAAMNGRVDTAKLLLSRGADVKACAGEHGSALTHAASTGGCDMVRLLLDHHADPNAVTAFGRQSPLMFAADYAQDDAAGLLIAARADVNARDRSGCSALMRAAARGHDSTVRLLLAAGADRAARDRDGATAADYAAHSGYPATRQLLARITPAAR